MDRTVTDRRRGSRPTRRQILSAAGSAGLVGLAGCGGGSSSGGGGSGDGGGGDGAATTQPPTSEYANYPVSGDAVTVGVSVPQSGSYSQEGEQLLAGYELARTHLNDGGGLVDTAAFEALGQGLRGREVELVVADSASTGEGARAAGSSLVDDGAIALVGGASRDEAIAHQTLATDERLVHMVGFAPANAVTGEHCSYFGFQELFNGRMMAKALRPVLEERFGTDASFAQVRPRSSVGESLARSVDRELTGDAEWESLATVPTRVGTQQFRGPIQEALDADPRVLFLDYYGIDGAYALRHVAEVVPESVAVVVPLFDRPMARNARGGLEGVIGTVAWDPTVDRPVSRTFTESWVEAPQTDDRGLDEPSGLAHLAYVQLLQYAAAVERAGSFEPPAVVDQLEGHTYDVGLGEEELRACDHQAVRPVPVVEGLSEADQYGSRFYELLGVETDAVRYDCAEEPASRCAFDRP